MKIESVTKAQTSSFVSCRSFEMAYFSCRLTISTKILSNHNQGTLLLLWICYKFGLMSEPWPSHRDFFLLAWPVWVLEHFLCVIKDFFFSFFLIMCNSCKTFFSFSFFKSCVILVENFMFSMLWCPGQCHYVIMYHYTAVLCVFPFWFLSLLDVFVSSVFLCAFLLWW